MFMLDSTAVLGLTDGGGMTGDESNAPSAKIADGGREVSTSGGDTMLISAGESKGVLSPC